MATLPWNQLDDYGKLTSALVLIVDSLPSLQPVLAARLKALDRQFGLDIVYVFHKTMGMIAAFLQVNALAFFMADRVRAVPKAARATSAVHLP